MCLSLFYLCMLYITRRILKVNCNIAHYRPFLLCLSEPSAHSRPFFIIYADKGLQR